MFVAPRPIQDLNLTPLIDVLLVLLVIFILTIPAATHITSFDIPAGCEGCPYVRVPANLLTLGTDDALL